MMYPFSPEPTRECLIKGVRLEYDACSSSSLIEAKKSYKNDFPNYIGSGRVYFINGTKNISKYNLHFFTK